MTRRLRDHQEANRFLGSIPKLVTRARRNSNALSGQQKNPLTIGFHHGLAGQNEEKLPGVSVEGTHLGRRAACSPQSRSGSDPAINPTPRSCLPKSAEHFPG